MLFVSFSLQLCSVSVLINDTTLLCESSTSKCLLKYIVRLLSRRCISSVVIDTLSISTYNLGQSFTIISNRLVLGFELIY